jgi:hypothetical protein
MEWKYNQPGFEYENVYWDAGTSWAGHKWFAYDLVSNVRPRRIVELGTHMGTSFFSFCQAVKDGGLATELNAVDTWKGDKHAGYYGESVWEEVNNIVARYYGGIDCRLLRMTFDEAVANFEDGSIDILHIDGLHTYEAVRHDFDNWFGKVADNGIVLVHDTEMNEGDFGVYRFWAEVKPRFPAMEFMHSFGLGVLCKGGEFGDLVLASYRDWQMHYSSIHEMIRYSSIDSLQKACKREKAEAQKTLGELRLDIDKIEHELARAIIKYETALADLKQEAHRQRTELLERHNGMLVKCALPTCFLRYFHKAFSPGRGRARAHLLEAYIIAEADVFDYPYYLGRYPELDDHPLVHFIERGASDLADPHPLFDTSFYLEKNPEIARSGMNPLAHYIEFGGAEGRDPHPLFDSSFYLERYPDVAEAKMNPLVHYLRYGSAELRVPHPLFDPAFYLESYPDVRDSGSDPLVHYLLYGAAEGRKPNALFDGSRYIAENPEAAQAGMNPLVHCAIASAGKSSSSSGPKHALKWGRWKIMKCLLGFLRASASNSLAAARKQPEAEPGKVHAEIHP